MYNYFITYNIVWTILNKELGPYTPVPRNCSIEIENKIKNLDDIRELEKKLDITEVEKFEIVKNSCPWSKEFRCTITNFQLLEYKEEKPKSNMVNI
jgi:hypothetical protein